MFANILPTEIQRIILLIGLAATGYLMILAWNEDFIQSRPVADRSAEPLLEETTGIERPAPIADAPLQPHQLRHGDWR